MMSARSRTDDIEGVRLVRDYYEAFATLDWDRLAAVLHPDFCLHEPRSLPWAGEYRGVAGLKHFVELFSKFWAQVTSGGVELYPSGDRMVFSVALFRGRVRATGRDLEMPYLDVWRIEDGLLLDHRPYWSDTHLILEAARPIGQEESS